MPRNPMSRYRYRQVLLFLLVLILPSVAIVLQSRKIRNDAHTIAVSQMKDRALEEQDRAISEIHVDMFQRLEAIKYREVVSPQIAAAGVALYSDPAVALVGWVEGGVRLVWPWSPDSAGEAVSFKD